MIRFLADENFSGIVYRGLLRRNPSIDIVRVQDLGLTGISDPDLLEFAGAQNRVLLTHDVQTLVGFAYERVSNLQRMPGVFAISQQLAHLVVIDDLLLLAE